MSLESFLAAIRESPEEDTHRLVCADWFDDQGDGDRAEFIRTQVQLGRLKEDDPQRPGLEQLQRELLEVNEPRWVGRLPDTVTDWSFRGGFLDGIVRRRIELLEAALTILRYGRQHGDQLQRGRPLGSFEQWAEWVRDPLLTLGCADPVEEMLPDGRRSCAKDFDSIELLK